MKTKQPIDIKTLFKKVLGDTINDFTLPPPIFTAMQGEIIEYDEENKSLTTKLPVLEQWLNPYGTMQGGMIDASYRQCRRATKYACSTSQYDPYY
jgi:hypothetical protein